MNKYFKVSTITFILIAVLLGSTIALAGTAYSSTSYFSAYGRDYYDYCGVSTGATSGGNTYADGFTRIALVDFNSTVPAGYMGAKVRVYNESSQLVASTSFAYNSSTTGWFDSDHAYYAPAGSRINYFSSGIVRAYNGSGYTEDYTYSSPYQTTP